MNQLLHLLDRPVAYQRSFVRLGAGVTGALLLSQLIYWQTRMGDVWFYKTQAEIEDETGLTRYEQEGARKKLVASGVLQEQKKGIPAKLYFRVNAEALALILLPDMQHTRPQKPNNQGCGNSASSDAVNQQAGVGKIPERVRGKPASIHTVDYTETTTENINPIGASAGAATPTGISGSAGSSMKTTSKQSPTRQEYPPDFEQAWQAYPKRAGGNPKATAYKHWKARLADGVAAADLLAGVQRYAAFIRATGKTGTEYVKQAATFFGPDRHFEELWTPPAVPNAPGGARSVLMPGDYRTQDYGDPNTDFLR
ncbi:hypothetical protein ACEF96_004401 [Salmonella enterica]|nr:hypothetical protein [Salmonella enterica]